MFWGNSFSSPHTPHAIHFEGQSSRPSDLQKAIETRLSENLTVSADHGGYISLNGKGT